MIVSLGNTSIEGVGAGPMYWRIKGAIQKALGALPGGEILHYILQRHFGGLRDFIRECDIKVDDWRLMMGHLKAVGIEPVGKCFLEMGTGWYPTFPLCLYLAGASRVHTVDLNRHLRADLMRACAARLADHVALIGDAAGRSHAEVEARQRELARALERGRALEAATNGTVEYRAPCDACATGLPAQSVDVVFSNSVLEHVPGPVIAACFAESRRILRPGGVIFHSVNCGDHYAYVDRSINQLNYLRFSEQGWRKWNNEFLYQNRLRSSDFTRMARDAGFEIEVDTSRAKLERLAQLGTVPVHADFARYSRDELAITSIDFIGRNAGSAGEREC